MGETTGIGWTKHTFNGWIGCTVAGPGCDSCYARDLDTRYQYGVPPEVATANRAAGLAPHWGVGAPRHRTSAGNWKNLAKWNRKAEAAGLPASVFAFSLADVFDNEVPRGWRYDFWNEVRDTPWLRYIVVTKRVPNIRKMLPHDWGKGFHNVGLVATVVNQEELDRDGPRLLEIPARWHGFSMEPQIGPIRTPDAWAHHMGSIWCITGGESRQEGHEPRAYDPAWAAMLLDERRLSNVYVFVKQTGAKPDRLPAPADGMGKDPAAWPKWMRVQEFPPELLA